MLFGLEPQSEIKLRIKLGPFKDGLDLMLFILSPEIIKYAFHSFLLPILGLVKNPRIRQIRDCSFICPVWLLILEIYKQCAFIEKLLNM